MLEWLQNPYVAIAVAIGAMFFGYFFGLFEGRGQGYKRRQAEETEEKERDTPEVQAEPALPPGPVLQPEEDSVLHVSRDDAGDLHLKLDGERIEAASLNPERRKRLIAVLTQIRPWLEAPSPAPKPAQPGPSRSAPAPEPRPAPSSRPFPAPVSNEEEPAAAPTSIVAQIDSILHAQLAGTPLAGKGIRLQESPEGGVIVWVGIDKYLGIEEVPDDQIKAAIRTAISAWEKKYTPGL